MDILGYAVVMLANILLLVLSIGHILARASARADREAAIESRLAQYAGANKRI